MGFGYGYDTQQHAMKLDYLDRENSMKIYEKLLGFMSGADGTGVGGGGTTTSGKLGLADAETRLAALLDDPESIQKTGSYKFRVGQGQDALERSLGAKGLLGSGNRLTELTKYGQDMGSQEYENQFGRLSGLLGRYMTSRDNQFGSLAGALGSGAIGRGGTDPIWGAFGNVVSSENQSIAAQNAAMWGALGQAASAANTAQAAAKNSR